MSSVLLLSSSNYHTCRPGKTLPLEMHRLRVPSQKWQSIMPVNLVGLLPAPQHTSLVMLASVLTILSLNCFIYKVGKIRIIV